MGIAQLLASLKSSGTASAVPVVGETGVPGENHRPMASNLGNFPNPRQRSNDVRGHGVLHEVTESGTSSYC